MTTLTKTVEGAEIHLENVAAACVRGHDVHLTNAVLVSGRIGGDLEIRQGGAGPLSVGGSVRIEQGGCGPIRAGGDVTIVEGGCGPISSKGNVTIRDATARNVVADTILLEDGAKVGIAITRATARVIAIAAAAGVVLGAIAGAKAWRRY